MPPGDLTSRLPSPWRGLATGVCETLASAGFQGWIVGGAVRDLLLGRTIKDVDLVSAALPEVVEGLFDRTVAVGKSFGIIVVVLDGVEVEVATFRRERGYSDRRRPDEVEYASSPEEDAGRRDFTCNAIYLDPLTGEVRDPVGGVADLRGGILRAVGDAGGRFREDGLRILRMARFVSTFGLEPAPGLLAAAELEGESLEGVSAERVRDELLKTMGGGRPFRALELLVEGGHASRCLPSMGSEVEVRARLEALRRVEASFGDRAPGSWGARDAGLWEVGLAVLFGPATWPMAGDSLEECLSVLSDRLTELRCSREERREVAEVCVGCAGLLEAASTLDGGAELGDPEVRGGLVQLWRLPARPAAAVLARAWTEVAGQGAALARLRDALAELESLDASAPQLPVMLTAGDLQDLGVPRGPELGRLLHRVQRASLGGGFTDRDGALAWARRQVR